MNCKYLKQLSKKQPALARLIELSIISWVVYILSAIIAWEAFSAQAVAQAALVPLLAFMSKVQRDLQKK